jgi:hypothetical protein
MFLLVLQIIYGIHPSLFRKSVSLGSSDERAGSHLLIFSLVRHEAVSKE